MASLSQLDEPTIFAPASGFGRAAVAVIRLSGSACRNVVEAMTGPLPEPRTLSLRALRDPATGKVLDHGLVAFFPGPASFTGEDMAELHLHGGLAVRSAVLRTLAAFPDLRAATAGEFSRRAFMKGRLDLTEAEGIADLIDAETEAQRRQALRQLDGVLGRQAAAWREMALDLLVRAEAALDFADEGDVDDVSLDAGCIDAARALRDAIGSALGDNRRGERLREGFVVVLAGPPNAGKSTLLNAIAGRDVAIVSDMPGTTRDAIELRCDLGGLPVILVDTAGLRETTDVIEAEGVRRTRRRMEEADLVLSLAPADGPRSTDDAAPRRLRVLTKADLLSDQAFPTQQAGAGTACVISALSGRGLERLLDRIRHAAEAAIGGDTAIVTRERHREALSRACAHLDRIVATINQPPELVAEDLRLAVSALGEVGGKVGVEDILDRLFSGFCIGK